MILHQPTADVFVPDGLAPGAALQRITHLGIGAHQDDLEFMAFHGILECFGQSDRWFGGVTCTNGAGSPRGGVYAACTDEQMRAIRREEQRAAAAIGRYGAMLQLDYPSSAIKSATTTALKDDLQQILMATRPQVVYTHNLADKHDTHIGVAVATVQALRELPCDRRPAQVWGCEIWRDLDWLPDADKVLMDVSAHGNLAAALNGVFDSQIAGGKRYDLATQGRRQANATFLESHACDQTTMQIFGMDLTPLVADAKLDIVGYVCGFIEKFRREVQQKLNQRLGL
ncbi:MAG: PIG-L family deacetylase [Kiritimatiellaeota bacterium]|nr:PIG-L family deacetylase [Kiritimatiellota bacterium]